ncbi:MAG: Rnf-Nqr domain containing protein [Oscillospiraceae bacterium]|nr:Rnf-Nqr domain containing protein [Oscillospiraceae bacterium]
MNADKKKNGSFFSEYALFRNPILCEIIGVAPVLAVAVSIKTGLLLSAMMFCSLIINEALTKVFFEKLSAPVRMLMYFLTGSAVSVTAMAVTDKLLPTLSAELGLFLPLTAVSSFTAVHCERYAVEMSKHPFAKHALFSAAGYTFVTLAVSAVRELAAYGTLFGLKITSHGISRGYLMPFFALILMGFMSAVLKAFAERHGSADVVENAFMEHSILVDGESAEEDMRRFVRIKTAFAVRKKAQKEKKTEKERIKSEKKRIEAERRRVEAERKEKEKNEKAERERLEKERAERERLEKERAERERLEKERTERERLEKERAERERLKKERAERERLEKERLEAAERARNARAEIEERREVLRREEELRRAEAKKREEAVRAARMSAEEEKMRMREQAEKERFVRKAVMQEERRRRKLGLPSLTSEEIATAFESGSVRAYGTPSEKRGNAKNPYIMPLSDDGEEKMR